MDPRQRPGNDGPGSAGQRTGERRATARGQRAPGRERRPGERRATGRGHRAPGTERREHRATGRGAPSTEHRAPSTEHRASSIEHRAPGRERRAGSGGQAQKKARAEARARRSRENYNSSLSYCSLNSLRTSARALSTSGSAAFCSHSVNVGKSSHPQASASPRSWW